MFRVRFLLLLSWLFCCHFSFSITPHVAINRPDNNIRIAVVSDVHIQDTSVVRSMDAQLHSTRLFNENYFAFLAALDNIANKGIHYVILSGDLTDNGQPANVRLVKTVLDGYASKYDMHFFLMTGNHDPYQPVTVDDSVVGIKWGYDEIHREWSAFGFYPQRSYSYWATPYSTYSYTGYTYDKALLEASWPKRSYHYYQGEHPLNPIIEDGSYVVEPIKGVWLLAIDAAVYNPKVIQGDSIISYYNALAGYNDALKAKTYLLPWIHKIVQEAHKQGKMLIAFSHFPMTDYNNGAAGYITSIAAYNRFDIERFPQQQISEILADAGITLHFSGHIHMNNDEIYLSKKGNRLHNVLVPTTAGYYPAYKILTISPSKHIHISTVPLDTVASFNCFFGRYRAEYDSLQRVGYKYMWNDSILNSKDYHQFCEWHLRELVRLRYMPNDLKPVAQNLFAPMSANELFTYVGLRSKEKMCWTGFDFIVDFYKLRFADELAFRDISSQRLDQYRLFINQVKYRKSNRDLDRFLSAFCRIFDAKLLHLNK